jgi:hypothetical protein
MVSTYSTTKPFTMTADTSRSVIALPQDVQLNRNLSDVNTIKIKSELTWSQLVHAEIIGKVTY